MWYADDHGVWVAIALFTHIHACTHTHKHMQVLTCLKKATRKLYILHFCTAEPSSSALQQLVTNTMVQLPSISCYVHQCICISASAEILKWVRHRISVCGWPVIYSLSAYLLHNTLRLSLDVTASSPHQHQFSSSLILSHPSIFSLDHL